MLTRRKKFKLLQKYIPKKIKFLIICIYKYLYQKFRQVEYNAKNQKKNNNL